MFEVKQSVADYLNIIVTHACNMKCAFCIDEYRNEDVFVSLEHVEKALKFAKKKNVKDILLIGGEPTLHPMIVEIAQLTKSYGFRVILTTNYTKPDVVKALDGIVDCFNISFYSQRELPKQCDFVSDLTIHAIIHRKQLNTREKLDSFIDKYREYAHLKFSTLTVCNDWTEKMQSVPYLDSLPVKKMVLFNEIEGMEYRGCVIKRHDIILNPGADQSYKAHTNGQIIKSWKKDLIALSSVA
ncbi:TPA: radical SAM protein [Vibrio vulnificus]|nr:radical SAM protein [Vibrio vulnificus]